MSLQESHPAPATTIAAAGTLGHFGIRGGVPGARTLAGLKLLRNRGVLNEVSDGSLAPFSETDPGSPSIPAEVWGLIPASVARENIIMPLKFDGETITVAAVNADDIALADRLRFLLAKNIKLVAVPRHIIVAAIDRHYGQSETEDDIFEDEYSLALDEDSEDDIFAASAYTMAGTLSVPPPPVACRFPLAGSPVQFLKDLKSLVPGQDPTGRIGGNGMFFYTVEEGQRVLLRRPNGTMQIIVGPKRVWRGWNKFVPMKHFVAHPDKFLVIRFRDGRQQHLAGPADLWLDPREHQQIAIEDALPLAAKEAVVVYTKNATSAAVSRRIVFGPALFVPQPGEWLHTFSWHASKSGSKGVQKIPNGLVFQKLWLMPDQMYHDVSDVRTADDALLTIRLMIFFELMDIERMLEATHDPIGDFVNAASSDVVAFTSRYDFDQFKRNTSQLNELEAYPQLAGRAAQCGYRINKVVYRGYGAADSLQQMHDQAIEARTRLQLQRATEQQAQDLENYKLDCQLARAGKRRVEQIGEVEHDLEMACKRQEAELRQREARRWRSRARRPAWMRNYG